MWKDPIVEEVRAIREAYSKRFGHDLTKIGADLMKKQKARLAAEARKKAAKKPKAAVPKGKSKSAKRRKAE